MNRISFSEWLLFQAGYKSEFDLGLLPEVFGADAILGHEPKDAKWEPPLNTDSNSYHYYFNVPGDDCGTKDSPCYDARMSLNSNKEASLSFYRDSGVGDAGKGVSGDSLLSVLKGFAEFIQAKNPKQIHWSAIEKTEPAKKGINQGKKVNPEARKHIYEKWAIRNLFPDKYVPLDPQTWLRRDAYDKEYVSLGYPAIPPEIKEDTPPGQKAKVIQELTAKATSMKDELDRRQAEAEERRQALELDSMLQDPSINPERLAIGDDVEVSEDWGSHEPGLKHSGKIKGFRKEGSVLFAKVDLDTGDEYNLRVSHLKKDTPELAQVRAEAKRQSEEKKKQELERLIQDPNINPNGVKVDDDVEVSTNWSSGEDGIAHTGKVLSFEKNGTSLLAKIKLNDGEEYKITPRHLKKDTPELAQARQDKKRQIEEGKRQKEERERRELEDLIQNPNTNPLGLKIGDDIEVSTDWSSNEGIPHYGKITNFVIRRSSYGQAPVLQASVILDDGENHDIGVNYLKKDTPELAQARQEKERAREEQKRKQAEFEAMTDAEKIQLFLSDPQKNPYHLRIGDPIISYLGESPHSSQHGLKGTIAEIKVSGSYVNNAELTAKINWDEHAAQVIGRYVNSLTSLSNLRPYSAELENQIERDRRLRAAEEDIGRRRDRQGRVLQQASELEQNSAQAQELVNDTENNPQGLKVGDPVKITGGYPYRYVGRSGIIVSMNRSSWGSSIDFNVKFHGSNAEPRRYSNSNLAKDDSPESQQIVQRQQRRINRTQQVQSATQSHPNNLVLGDMVRVNSGMNRNKTGKIVRFATGTQNNVRATLMDNEGHTFSANITNLEKIQNLAASA